MKKKRIRVLIVADSLGCPRPETNVYDTWPDMILQKWCNNNIVFYTYCRRGLSAHDMDYDRIHLLMPDIIIFQIGVVDCCRRVLTQTELKIVSKIPGINKIVHAFCSKHMHSLTRIRNKHYLPIEQFKEKMQSIIDNNQCAVYFIEIAPASNYMNRKVYNFENDVKDYNSILKNLEYKNGGGIIETYKDVEDPETLFLADGHHLTTFGTDLVYKSVDKVLQDFANENG